MELEAIIRQFEEETGYVAREVGEGVIPQGRYPNPVSYHVPGYPRQLLIERSIRGNDAALLRELTHEFAAFLLERAQRAGQFVTEAPMEVLQVELEQLIRRGLP